MKEIDGMLFIKTPLRVFVDSRPAILKFTQEVEFKDPKIINTKETKATKITLSGYFKRISDDSYRQLNAIEGKKVLGWMIRNEVKPQDLTLSQVGTALASVLELLDDEENRLVVPGVADSNKSPGGIIIPG